METVQEERYSIREKYMTELSQQIHGKYGNDYDYTMLKDAERGVNRKLHEKSLSLQRKLNRNRQRQHAVNQDRKPKHRNHEQEQ